MKKKQPSKIEKLLAFVIVVSFIGYFVYSLYTSNKLDESSCRTIGVTIKYTNAGRTGTFILYKYNIDGKEYENETANEKDVKVPGGKYLVKYLCDEPSVSKIYFDKPLR